MQEEVPDKRESTVEQETPNEEVATHTPHDRAKQAQPPSQKSPEHKPSSHGGYYPSPLISINLQLPRHRPVTEHMMRVPKTATILEFKRVLVPISGIPADRQRLWSLDRMPRRCLQNEKTLEEYGLEDQSEMLVEEAPSKKK